MKLETKAKKTLEYIKEREARGFTVNGSLKIKAHRILSGDYKEKEIPHLNDMMTRETVRQLSKGPGAEIYAKLDWMMRNHPSRERARDVIGFVQELEVMSKTQILPKGKSMEQLRVNAMKYVPSPSRIDKLLERADNKEIPIPATALYQNQIRQTWSQYGEGEEGFREYRLSAQRRGYATFKVNHSNISPEHMDKLMDFVDNSRNWQKFRRQIKSDEFIMELGDLLMETDYYDDDETPDLDWRWLDAQLETATDIKKVLNEFSERSGMEWRI